MGSEAAARFVDDLERTWRSIDALCVDLTDAEWATPTGCPGWSVQDNVAHLVDYESAALGRPRPDHVPADVSHTRNPMGEANEVGVDARRGRPGREVLAELREVAAERLVALRALTDADLAQEARLPLGKGTQADLLTLRVMDTWCHEQDIRRALGRPGHEDGPAAEDTVAYFARFLPLLVGKRAGAPEGASILVEVGGTPFRVVVRDGRAGFVDALDGEPTVTIRMSAPSFAAHVGGRADAPDDHEVAGDAALARAVVANLGFLP